MLNWNIKATVLAAITVTGLVAGVGLWAFTAFEHERALQRHVAAADAEASTAALHVESKLRHIYESIRTLAALPSVRKIDRHGANIDADARNTFQQIYNNLAYGVDVSEVYILPAALDPGRIDPLTGKPEEPILMFDELIVGGGKNRSSAAAASAAAPLPRSPEQEEVEIHEYRQYGRQLAWLRAHVPDDGGIDGLNVPMVSGPEIITCDNRFFIASGDDRVRSRSLENRA